MDRQIVYPGSIPLDTDLLSIQRNVMVAIGFLAQATLGQSTVADGLACQPTSPASLTVVVGPGSLASLGVIDATPFGSLAAASTQPLVKLGIATDNTSFTLTPPATSGQAINYLIQASVTELDASPVVLPFYNAANPAQPFSGAANSGTAQNTQRLQRVQLQVKPAPPANIGTQSTAAVDAGWVGLYVVSVGYGQSQITAANIGIYPGAPFIAFKLNTLTPGFSRMVTLGGSGNFMVPNGVTALKLRACGGGGGGGSGTPTMGGGGGGAGGYAEGVYSVVPGQVLAYVVGTGGSGGLASGAGSTVGSGSSFGNMLAASGGGPGAAGMSYAYGGIPGNGFGGTLNVTGGYGSDGNAGSLTFAGNGGSSFFGGGGRAASVGSAPQMNGSAPGSGGGACYSSQGNGGNGANGIIIVEY